MTFPAVNFCTVRGVFGFQPATFYWKRESNSGRAARPQRVRQIKSARAGFRMTSLNLDAYARREAGRQADQRSERRTSLNPTTWLEVRTEFDTKDEAKKMNAELIGHGLTTGGTTFSHVYSVLWDSKWGSPPSAPADGVATGEGWTMRTVIRQEDLRGVLAHLKRHHPHKTPCIYVAPVLVARKFATWYRRAIKRHQTAKEGAPGGHKALSN